MLKNLSSILFSLTLFLSLGCSPFVPSFYEVDVRQGHYLDQEKINQLQTGMSKRQVQILMGQPLLSDPFHPNRWDYVYRFKRDGDLVTNRHISLFFEGELLSRIEDSAASP
jgi:outer membrane protein assembly factor BamE